MAFLGMGYTGWENTLGEIYEIEGDKMNSDYPQAGNEPDDEEISARSPKTEISIERQARKKRLRQEIVGQLKDQADEPEGQSAKLQAILAAPTRRLPHGLESVRSIRDMPIAYVYLRVSTKEQARTGGGAEGYSIPAQREACLAKGSQLGAVVYQYVDAGESAKSADRKDLQRMLKDIKLHKPDYVIVHKIDRLARNREDDIAINVLLKKHGVKLISCTENIDDTPSGKLLHGLMAEIAQFYLANLSQEVMKGLLQKAEEGGTPYRAPLGYLNHRQYIQNIEIRTITLDPKRADIIRWCFEQYATGEWSGISLTIAARAKGLTTRATATKPEQPISLSTIYNILQNPYYMGIVPYQGIHYEGKHPALVEPDIWLACQDTLAAHARRGEKDRKHPHYLRTTIHCSNCNGRLVYSQNTGNGGTYQYYMCVKKKTKENNCTRPAVRVERIEAGIAALYSRFVIAPEFAEGIRAAVHSELAGQQEEAGRSLLRAKRRKQQLTDERKKLLHAHYAGIVPQEVLADEMTRFTRELAAIDGEVKAAKASTTAVEATLELALTAAANCQTAYLTAPDHIKRQINQGFFHKLWIDEDGSVERAELTEPFAALLNTGQSVVIPSQMTPDEAERSAALDTTPDRSRPSSVFTATFGNTVTPSNNKTALRKISLTKGGLNGACVVENLLTTWNLIKRELIVAAEIYQSMRITYLIETKPQG